MRYEYSWLEAQGAISFLIEKYNIYFDLVISEISFVLEFLFTFIII